MLLPKYGLVTFIWGNVSEIDRAMGVLAIKPSGIDYDKLKVEDIVLVDLAGHSIPCYGATHADYMYREIPCVRNLTKEEQHS